MSLVTLLSVSGSNRGWFYALPILQCRILKLLQFESICLKAFVKYIHPDPFLQNLFWFPEHPRGKIAQSVCMAARYKVPAESENSNPPATGSECRR